MRTQCPWRRLRGSGITAAISQLINVPATSHVGSVGLLSAATATAWLPTLGFVGWADAGGRISCVPSSPRCGAWLSSGWPGRIRTFLVQLFTEFGFDTGLSRWTARQGINVIAHAGLEHQILDDCNPYMTKSPWFPRCAGDGADHGGGPDSDRDLADAGLFCDQLEGTVRAVECPADRPPLSCRRRDRRQIPMFARIQGPGQCGIVRQATIGPATAVAVTAAVRYSTEAANQEGMPRDTRSP